MSDCEYEIDGEDFMVQEQEIVITNDDDDDEEDEDLYQNNVIVDDDDDVINNVQIVESHGGNSDDDEDEDEVESNLIHNSDSESESSSSNGNSSSGEEDPNVGSDVMSDAGVKTQQTVGDPEEEEDDDDEEEIANHSETNQNNEKSKDVKGDDDIDPSQIDENGVYKWKEFIGAKMRLFTKEEYQTFQKPFEEGWKRELVLRCTGSTAEKKAGDVYYHTPDGTTKLRSYVEMNQYIKRHPDCQLTVDNFSFAKQPVYRPPDEIVRHAMQRGANFIERPFFFNKHIRHQNTSHKTLQSQQQQTAKSQSLLSKPIRTSTTSTVAATTTVASSSSQRNGSMNEDSNDANDSSHGPLGRGKRKRVLPSRYDDNDFDYVHSKKKFKDSMSNGNSQDSISPQSSNKSNSSSSKMTAQERRRTLQQQLYQQIHEEQIKKEKLEEKQQQMFANVSGNGEMNKDNDCHQSNIMSPLKMKISKFTNNAKSKKSEEVVGESIEEPVVDTSQTVEPGEVVLDNSLKVKPNESSFRQPCTAYCPGRRNVMPNLLCSRCFCLFHLECVPDGVFLEEPKNLFICPSCVTSEEKIKNDTPMVIATTTSTTTASNKKSSLSQMEQPFFENEIDLSLTPSIPIQTPLWKTSNSLLKKNHFLNGSNEKRFGRWSKPLMRQTNGMSQTKLHPMVSKFAKRKPIVPKMPTIQPSINHVYRVTHGTNGHSVVIKDKTHPLKKTATNWLQEKQSLMDAAQQLARHQYYNTLSGKPTYNLNTAKLFEERFNSILSMITSGSFAPGSNSSTIPFNVNSKYYKYLQSNRSVFKCFDDNLSGMLRILEYCDLKDIMSLRATCKMWYKLTSIPDVWKRLYLRGLTITDWKQFSSFLSQHQPVLLDFSGVRLSNSHTTDSASTTSSSSNSSKFSNRNEKLCHFWRLFSTIHSNLNTVQTLKFGTIPIFVLNELCELARESNVFCSLQTLSISNITCESSKEPISLETFVPLEALDLRSIRIESANGLILPAGNSKKVLLERALGSLTCSQGNQLTSFSCTTIKDFTSEEFDQLLTKLNFNCLTHLELGSCLNWFLTLNNSTFEQLSKFTSVISLKLSDVLIGSNCKSFVSLFESLIIVEHLSLDNIQIDTTGYIVWNSLIAMFKSLPLYKLNFSTDDSFSNRAIFECCRELISTQKRSMQIIWTVTVTIDDVGHCYVPLCLETFPDSLDYDFVKRYFSTKHKNSTVELSDQYQIVEQQQSPNNTRMILVEMSTLSDLLNRDCNLNYYTIFDSKVSVQIIPK